MNFERYMHIERFGVTEVEGIEFGECFIFPKIDGTNSQLWFNENLLTLFAGSRSRILSLDNDNQGFYAWALQQDNILSLLKDNPNIRLCGEWLVPHTLKTYREDAWRHFWVFDVYFNDTLISYNDYKDMLDRYNVTYIPPICSITNPTYKDLVNKLDSNTFLIKDGQGFGEGIVIKNYNYRNKFGRQVWAKIVRSEFKEKHVSTMGHPEMHGSKMIEESFVKEYLTKASIDKVKANIENECSGWSSKYIPRLLGTVFYDLVHEETWNFLKENKFPTINFKTVQHFTNSKIKELLPEIF